MYPNYPENSGAKEKLKFFFSFLILIGIQFKCNWSYHSHFHHNGVVQRNRRRHHVTGCNLAVCVRVGTWTERCSESSNNAADKGEFLLAKRMQSLQKFPVTSDPRRWWYSWEHDSNSLSLGVGDQLQQPWSQHVVLFAPLLNFNRWINVRLK